jgi:dihydroorotate dehydrogenase electron transfer subunit
VRAQIAFNRPLSSRYRHLGILAPGFPRAFAAGQFAMVRPPFATDPFLPRAFSIYRMSSADEDTPVVEILYQVIGKGTQCLSRMEPGQRIELLGPLGNAFAVPERLDTPVLVAGGIGVPPIAALAAALAKRRRSQATGTPGSAEGYPQTIRVFLGGKTADDVLCVKDFEAAGATLAAATEDGSLGARGLVTDLLEPFLRGARSSATAVFTCGPPGMLAAVARLAEQHGVPCQASVEENMACGFGACMGCAVEVRTHGDGPRYKLVCKDGPVFDSRELVWR